MTLTLIHTHTLTTNISSLGGLTSFFSAQLHPGRPLRWALAGVTGHPDGVQAVGLQVPDEVCGWWDAHILVVDDLVHLLCEVVFWIFGLEHSNNKLEFDTVTTCIPKDWWDNYPVKSSLKIDYETDLDQS